MNRFKRALQVANVGILVAATSVGGYNLQAEAAPVSSGASTSTHARHAPLAAPSVDPAVDAARPVANTPAQLLRLLGERIVAKDVNGIIALQETNAAIIDWDLTLIKGHANIRAFYIEWFKTNPVLTVNPQQTFVSGGQRQPDGTLLNRTASIMGTYSLTQDAEGGGRETFTGNFCDIVRQQANGTWLYVQDNPYPPHGDGAGAARVAHH